jgi:hypothetical protein
MINYLPIKSFIYKVAKHNQYIQLPKCIHPIHSNNRDFVHFINNPELILCDTDDTGGYVTIKVTTRQHVIKCNNMSATTIQTVVCYSSQANPHYYDKNKMDNFFYETFVLLSKPNTLKYNFNYSYRWKHLPTHVKESTPKYFEIQQENREQPYIQSMLENENIILPDIYVKWFEPIVDMDFK